MNYSLKYDKLGRCKADGPCVFHQTACVGLSIADCILCKPYTRGDTRPNYPVPALYYSRAEVYADGITFSYNSRKPWWFV